MWKGTSLNRSLVMSPDVTNREFMSSEVPWWGGGAGTERSLSLGVPCLQMVGVRAGVGGDSCPVRSHVWRGTCTVRSIASWVMVTWHQPIPHLHPFHHAHKY